MLSEWCCRWNATVLFSVLARRGQGLVVKLSTYVRYVSVWSTVLRTEVTRCGGAEVRVQLQRTESCLVIDSYITVSVLGTFVRSVRVLPHEYSLQWACTVVLFGTRYLRTVSTGTTSQSEPVFRSPRRCTEYSSCVATCPTHSRTMASLPPPPSSYDSNP